jgi:hypothetical protein
MTHADYFISYSRQNWRFVNRLQRAIEKHSRTVWRDVTNLPPGADFEEEIRQALKDVDTVLVILSPDAVNSLYVQGEIAVALETRETREKVIPCIHRKCKVPLRLQGLNCIDFRYTRKDALQSILDHVPQKPAPWWARVLRKTGLVPPLAALAVLLGFAAYFGFFKPSQTEAVLPGRDSSTEIRVVLQNHGARPSMVVGPYWLRFGDLPIVDASLARADKNGDVVPGYGSLEIALSRERGFEPKQLPDGSYKDAGQISDALKPSDFVTLQFGVKETRGAGPLPPIRIPQPTIRAFVIPQLPEIVPRENDGH